MNKITALPVERDEYGHWTHPEYAKFCSYREYIHIDEFSAWVKSHGLEWAVRYCYEDDFDLDSDGADISAWKPECPDGEGWFVGSIHDTEDGAVCIWLRNAEGGAA